MEIRLGMTRAGWSGAPRSSHAKVVEGATTFSLAQACVATLVLVPTDKSIARLNLAGDALTPGAQRSWWLREALEGEPASECPPLRKDANADVVIVGGGFTGLWTASFLTEA